MIQERHLEVKSIYKTLKVQEERARISGKTLALGVLQMAFLNVTKEKGQLALLHLKLNFQRHKQAFAHV